MSNKKVSLIVLNYKTWKDTIECLENLLKINYHNFNIIVVDNDSPNNSMDYLINWANGNIVHESSTNSYLANLSLPVTGKITKDFISISAEDIHISQRDAKIVFIQSKKNGGYAAGNNIGINYSLNQGYTDYFWILNNDVVVEHDSLMSLVNYHLSKDVKVGIIGSKVLYYFEPKIIQAIGGKINKYLMIPHHIGDNEVDNGQYDNEKMIQKIDYPLGAALFVSNEFIKHVGLMKEDYFLYYEEIDWVERGKIKGWNIGYDWNSKVYHKDGISSKEDSVSTIKSKIADYHGLKNRLLITKRFYRKYYITVFLGLFISIMNRLRKKQYDRVKMIIEIMTGIKNLE